MTDKIFYRMAHSPPGPMIQNVSSMSPLTRQLHDILNIRAQAPTPQAPTPQTPFSVNRARYNSMQSDAQDYKAFEINSSFERPSEGRDQLASAIPSGFDLDHSFFTTRCDSRWGAPRVDFQRMNLQVPRPTPPPEAMNKNDATIDFLNSFKNDNYPKLWEGDLEKRDFNNGSGIFSKKIFIGGIPRDMTEEDIEQIFGQFDPDVKIEWPESRPNSRNTPKGYLYIILSTNENIRSMLYACSLIIEGGCETFNFEIVYKNKGKQLQVIPWLTSDSSFRFSDPTEVQKSKFTVFIGALHGRLHAKAIAYIFEKIFGNVISVSIDTDRHKYPTGSGRITFGTVESYTKAIIANFIQIEAKKLSKKVQIEPCIDGQKCCFCLEDDAPNFCKEPTCFEYFCNHCWEKRHSSSENLNHTPIRRKSKFEY